MLTARERNVNRREGWFELGQALSERSALGVLGFELNLHG